MWRWCVPSHLPFLQAKVTPFSFPEQVTFCFSHTSYYSNLLLPSAFLPDGLRAVFGSVAGVEAAICWALAAAAWCGVAARSRAAGVTERQQRDTASCSAWDSPLLSAWLLFSIPWSHSQWFLSRCRPLVLPLQNNASLEQLCCLLGSCRIWILFNSISVGFPRLVVATSIMVILYLNLTVKILSITGPETELIKSYLIRLFIFDR